MRKKPSLTVVEPALTANAPPRKLGEFGTNLWQSVTSAYDISDVGGIELLLQACTASDRAEALAQRIRHDGEVIYGRNGPKTHPALKEELALRAFIVRTLARLGLNVESVKPPGRPGNYSY